MRLELNELDLRSLFISAMRYAMGRQTYMPMLMTGIIARNLWQCSDNTLQSLANEIRDYATDEMSLRDTELNIWLELRATILKELGERHEPDTTETGVRV